MCELCGRRLEMTLMMVSINLSFGSTSNPATSNQLFHDRDDDLYVASVWRTRVEILVVIQNFTAVVSSYDDDDRSAQTNY